MRVNNVTQVTTATTQSNGSKSSHLSVLLLVRLLISLKYLTAALTEPRGTTTLIATARTLQ